MKNTKLFLTMLFCGVCATSCNLQLAEHKKISDDQSSQKRISDKQNSHNLKKDSALRTSLSEKLAIKKFYDKFIFKEEALKNKRLTASIPDDDVAVLVKVICQIFNIKNQQNAKEIIFDNKI